MELAVILGLISLIFINVSCVAIAMGGAKAQKSSQAK